MIVWTGDYNIECQWRGDMSRTSWNEDILI